MYPTCLWRDSYPHPAASTPKDIPSSHVKMDLSPPPNPPYQPWPYYAAANYCYPFPQEYHGCCNHGLGYYNGGGPYGFRPNYTHYPPPPPFHTHGFYPPSFPGVYPGYSVPPPHYSVEQPRYDYDKNNGAPHRCCGCNHRDDEKRLRIEEEPKVDKKTSESLVPFLLKDRPDYPVMWVPPGYMNSTEPKAKEEDKHSHDPVSPKLLEPSKQVGNGEMTQSQQGGGGDGNRFPFQIFWLPCKNDQVGKDNKENTLNLEAQKGLPEEKMIKNNEGSGSEAECNTSSVQKVIPVKQAGPNEEKQNPENMRTKVQSGSVVDRKLDNGSREGKTSPKTSKLPPVCLRIDPLPTKKKSSRSPSPPGDKHRSNESPVNSSQQQTQFTEGSKMSNEEQSKGNIETVEVTSDVTKVEKDNLGGKVPMEEGNEGETGMVHGNGESCKGINKNLSEHEAARIIQSVYRGFEVRKSKPLMKLRQIGDVGKQVLELRNRIRDLELSSSIDDKQKLVIGETIMSLLLKLDTIQGLHPIVRDIRKSVAKDLVGLQEKLDSLPSVKPEVPSAMTITKQVMHPEDDPIQDKSDQGQAQSGLHKDHEHQVAESQYDDVDNAEACNTNVEPQVEFHGNESKEDDGIHKELHQAATHIDSTNQIVGLDKVTHAIHEMKAPESQDGGGAGDCNANGEKQLESHNEESEHDKTDEVVGLDTSTFINNEVEATHAMDNGSAEAHDIKNSELVEQNTGEPYTNQLQVSAETEQASNGAVQDLVKAESDVTDVEIMMSGTCDANYNVETSVPPQNDGGCDMIHEPQVAEPEQEKSDQTPGHFESVESRDDGNAQTYENDVSMVDMKSELPKAGTENVHAEEAPNGGELEDDVGRASPAVTNCADGKLTEENEKLRVVVEELMKAGNEQLEVIKELTGRVKDLEKKLSRKKIKANKCKSRGRVVKEEMRDCLV